MTGGCSDTAGMLWALAASIICSAGIPQYQITLCMLSNFPCFIGECPILFAYWVFIFVSLHILSTKKKKVYTRGVFNNASAGSAIECFLSEALAIQVDRCIARKSKMATKTIMGFREGICTQYFRNDNVCFFVWTYEMEQFKLKVGRCFALISNRRWDLICLSLGAAILLSERSLSFITLTRVPGSARIVELASDVLPVCESTYKPLSFIALFQSLVIALNNW